ncbi:desert hedgehog protein precursor [Danio rerio]|uniref:Hedgehog protein n=1 Tax=Danio rerio TaxID=7955 RepID=F6NTL6_DANRE|nr:desert hedgehog protein precursor [Danio rerio]AAI63355.1 Desert hedgehog [Danio rerio]AAI63379.1 Desert hedgehog [Danio rerio]
MTLAPWLRLARLGLLTACLYSWLVVDGCGPGPGYGGRHRQRKLTPMSYKQYVPGVSENNLGASGRAEGRITRSSERFNELVCNYNTDIDFKDEERSNADRFMTKRCKDCLNKLAIAVMNQWPGVRLRVTEAWDEDGHHPPGSLHYEGRAVDITTSDRDTKKYGLLAQLAVEAGFDWVHYESKYHVHCSVKADHSVAVEKGGCFSASGLVTMADGVQKPMSCLWPGEKVLSVSGSGEVVFSRVLLFLHLDRESRTSFFIITTENEKRIALTPNHLIFAAHNLKLHHHDYETVFARNVRIGDYILTTGGDRGIQPSKVVSVSLEERMGVYAPLTEHGNLFVDGVLASNYATFQDHGLAHTVFWPFRVLFVFFNKEMEEDLQRVAVPYICSTNQTILTSVMHSRLSSVFKWQDATRAEMENAFLQQKEVYWYARLLHTLGRIFLDPQRFY